MRQYGSWCGGAAWQIASAYVGPAWEVAEVWTDVLCHDGKLQDGGIRRIGTVVIGMACRSRQMAQGLACRKARAWPVERGIVTMAGVGLSRHVAWYGRGQAWHGSSYW